MININEVTFEATLNGNDVTIEFERHTRWVTNPHYGADADGNRGVLVTEVEDDFWSDILVLSWDGPDGAKEIVTEFACLNVQDKATVQQLVVNYLETHEPDYDDVDDEIDYDDDDEEGADDEA